ncbi:glycosyl hydrolase [Agromyces mangrovi Wang et al. 2018]|uniref:glycosyl hydrolase n=1 Tax=Agromyces mangrovi TaxID=1858653 RepID=UPI0025729FCB|nr:glycosyl hydrolase [Agromyces mangrovi]BDZ65487.1 hypothetical protein GCM10025877_24250 [Agromyces mangrovi]
MTATSAAEPPSSATTAASSAFAQTLESAYIDPDRVFSSDVRWWLGEAAHTDEVLLEQIQTLYDGGFRGVELCMQNDNAAPNTEYAYGSEQWTHKWNLLMNKMLDLGMAVYLTSGTNWATSNVPGLDPTSQAAMQNLTLGTGTVAAGEELTALPAPAEGDREEGASFVTAYAYRVVDGDAVDPDSFVDLEGLVSEGADVWEQTLSWTAPDDGTYRVFGMWTQGTFQEENPSAEPSFTTNYFDERGVDALRAFWEEHYLADPALREKILEGDVQLFMDSLEIETGEGFTFWSEDMLEEFEARKGYDATPYLFLIDGASATFNMPYHSVATTGTYRLDGDESLRQRIVNDWMDVQTQLYRERMLQPLKEWLNSVGIETRAQISYGKSMELSEPAMDVDYPEAENLNQYNQIDIFRSWTGGAKLENKVLSSETSAIPIGWSATTQTRLQDAYSTYAAGFQRIVWHVWAAEWGYSAPEWPGFNPSPLRFLRFPLLGARDPGAENYDELNAHLGRVQQLMQTGTSRTDVGFINQKWIHGMVFGGGTGDDNNQMNWQLAHQGINYRSTELQDNGYTYDYFSPRFLFDDDVSFNAETQTIEQAGYKAIVLYQDWLDPDGAARILDWAKQGLKVVILEDAASQTPYNDGRDAELAAIMDELTSLPTVRTAEVFDTPAAGYFSSEPGGYDDNVLEQLQDLGVHPYSGYAEENHQLLSQTRQDDEGNQYVYLYNYDDGSYHQFSHKEEVRNEDHGTNIQTDIVQDGLFVPYTIDAWTGEVTELADYSWEDGKTIVPVDLDYNDIALLAFEKTDAAQLRVESTNADSAASVGGDVVVRTTGGGAVETALSDGREYTDQVDVPAAFDITDWNLTVQSWRPNDTLGDLVRSETVGSSNTTNYTTSTVKTAIEVELETLTTWDEIPEVGRAVSGEGRYEATFEWDADAASGAYLDFGDSLEETMAVWINGHHVGGDVSTNPTKVAKNVGGVGKPTIDDGTGQQVPLVGDDLYTGGVSFMKPTADVSEYLVDGENEIVIEYNSVLANVQLDRGIVREQQNASNWWGYDVEYLSFGPQQAVLVPFAEVVYPAATFDNLDALIDSLEASGDLNANLAANLRKAADKAEAFAAAGKTQAAESQLRALLNSIGNAKEGRASAEAADDLTQLAGVLQRMLRAEGGPQ